MRKKIIFSAFACVFFASGAHAAKFTVERVGDILQIAIPAMALGMTIEEPGWDGTRQFSYGFAASMTTESAFKAVVEDERPNKVNLSSFPSGHTMAAFSGATFIHRRYGLERAALPYLMAAFVGYSRIDSRWHSLDDVVAGAIMSGMWTMAFAERMVPPVMLSGDTHGAKLSFNFQF